MAFKDILQARALVGELELYEIQIGDDVEYFCSRQTPVVLEANHWGPGEPASQITYVPVPVGRGDTTSNNNLSGGDVNLVLPAQGQTDLVTLLKDGGMRPVEVRIIRGWGDPSNADNFQRYWFVGQLTELQSSSRVIACKLKDKLLFQLESTDVPGYRAQRLCNHAVYDLDTCGLLETDFEYHFEVDAIVDNNRTIRVSNISGQTDAQSKLNIVDSAGFAEIKATVGTYSLGKCRKRGTTDPKVRITAHSRPSDSNNIEFQLQFPATALGLQVGDEVTASWGCAHRIREDCIAKFNNRKKAFGCPDMPIVDYTLNSFETEQYSGYSPVTNR